MQELFTKFDIDFILQFLKECDFYRSGEENFWRNNVFRPSTKNPCSERHEIYNFGNKTLPLSLLLYIQ